MGLAASQARLLMLTSRKDDVECKMMSIANQKLAMSRQSAQLSQNYNDAINATKLTWDTGSKTVDLTYGLLMTPNSTNTAGQYLLTDSYSRVILNDTYANIFDPAGSATSGSASVDKYTFLEKTMNIDSTTAQQYADAYTAASTSSQSTSGSTGGYSDMQTSLTSLLTFLKKNSLDGSSQIPVNGSVSYKSNILELQSLLTQVSKDIDSQIQNLEIGDNKTQLTKTEIASMDWDNLSYKGDDGTTKYLRCSSDVPNLKSGQTQTINGKSINLTTGNTTTFEQRSELDYLIRMKRNINIINTLLEAYNKYSTYGDSHDTIAGNKDAAGTIGSGTGVYISEITAAISMLINGGTIGSYYSVGENQVMDVIKDGGDDTKTGSHHNDAGYNGPINGNALEKYTDYDYDGIWKNTKGGSSSTLQDGNRSSSNYNAFDENLRNIFLEYSTLYEKNAAATTTDTTTTVLTNQDKADYYLNLYNAIANNGWTRNSSIDNKDYLQNQLMNGNIVINQVKNGTLSALSTSDPDSPLNTESDEDAIKKAEADYDAKKDLLSSKEAQLDVTMNNLDTERSALTTEMDSVKKIIDKNIESSFKIFQA